MENENKDLQQPTENNPEMQHPDYAGEIVSMIRKGLPPMVLRDRILEYHENDIAEAMEQLTTEERTRLFQLLDTDTVIDILDYADEAGKYFAEMNVKKQLEILANCEADTAVDYLRALPKESRKILIDLMDDDDKKDVALIGSFDEDEIGSRMTTNYIRIPLGISVRQAMHELVEQAAEHDNISTLYVVDGKNSFYGAIDLKDLIIARETTPLKELVMSSFPYVYAREQVSDCIERIKAYYEDSIPVLDDSNRLLGVITAADIIEIADEEAGEDFAKFAGLTAEEDLNESLFASIKKRIPWLVTLMFLGLLVSSVVGTFEAVMAALPIAVAFQSMILDMSGNSGTQSLAVTIRILTDGELTGKQKRQLVLKEARVGFTNGLILGSISFIAVGLFVHFFKGKPFGPSFAMSGCIGISMVVAMTISALSGTLIPMFFKKIKVDPAVASGPMITTLSDLVAVVSYYSLVGVLLLRIRDMLG